MAGTLVNLDAKTLLYTPDKNFHGTDDFTYQVSDGYSDQVQPEWERGCRR